MHCVIIYYLSLFSEYSGNEIIEYLLLFMRVALVVRRKVAHKIRGNRLIYDATIIPCLMLITAAISITFNILISANQD